MSAAHLAAWTLVLAAYGVVSAISFTAYACDKRAARKGKRRIAERTLHFLDLIGGWPGGWLAQKTLRHKCSKPSFQRMYRLSVLSNAALLACLLLRF
ncbi:MAG TPA: DUF1294 domain-containing protein [Oxalicibacterium sp.]|nr:DUF1294 domain-containing protein [Oxalicibacterium sp.]